MLDNLPLSWPSFNFDVLCQPVVLQAVTRTEEKMAQFCPRRKDGAENQYSFNSIQYSLLLANIPVLSSLPPASWPITHPIQNETYTFQCSRRLWILFWYSHICSHHFLLMRVLRVFDSQSESSFLLTFVPCLLLPSSHFHFHFCRAFFDLFSKTFNFFFSFSFYFDPLKFFISTGVKASWTLELVGFHLNVFGNISPKTSINNVLLNILATQRSVL